MKVQGSTLHSRDYVDHFVLVCDLTALNGNERHTQELDQVEYEEHKE